MLTLDDLPDLDWSSRIREAMHADAALQIAADHDGSREWRDAAGREALAYFYAAWIVENENSDGRAGEALAVAGDVFLEELWRQHNFADADRPS